MINVLRNLLVTMLALLAGPSHAEQEKWSEQTVYIYRPSAFDLWGRKVFVKIDGITTAELTSCTYAKLKLSVGMHTIEVELKPWLFDGSSSKEHMSLVFNVMQNQPLYIGYYPNNLSASEIASTFILQSKIGGAYPRVLGTTRPEIASKEMVSCSNVSSLHE
jgi:hypothetical protein